MNNKLVWILLIIIAMPAALFFIPIIVLTVFIGAIYMFIAGSYRSMMPNSH